MPESWRSACCISEGSGLAQSLASREQRDRDYLAIQQGGAAAGGVATETVLQFCQQSCCSGIAAHSTPKGLGAKVGKDLWRQGGFNVTADGGLKSLPSLQHR